MVLDGECWTHLPVSISIAHCDGVAIAAAADSSTRVGVDIERVSGSRRSTAATFSRRLRRIADPSLAWVLKEAA
jgi:4'-phosphopantetheinyl transferase EntD